MPEARQSSSEVGRDQCTAWRLPDKSNVREDARASPTHNQYVASFQSVARIDREEP